jgi:hypothetical protein
MSKRLDLFTEKILSGMIVDDVQRAEIEREVGSHLREAVEEGRQRGLPEDLAEEEAMLQFGRPSIIAARFKMRSGLGWFLFERLAFVALLTCLCYLFGSLDSEAPVWAAPLLYGSIFTVFLIAKPLWDRIEVNGGLFVKRLFRRSVTIPFEDISDVVLGRGHLFGARRLIVRFEGGKTAISSKTRGMRVCALALDALAPEALNENVGAYLRRRFRRLRVEGPWFIRLAGAAWLIILGLFLAGAAPLWHGEGLTWLMAIAWPAALILVFIQGTRHTDRARAGLCWALTISFLLSLGPVAIGLFFGSAFHCRWAATLFALSGGLALSALWWRGRRLTLLAVACLAGILAVGSMWAIPSELPFETEIVGPVLDGRGPYQFQWLDGGRGAAMLFLASPDEVEYDRPSPIPAGDREKSGTFLWVRFPDGETVTRRLGKSMDWEFAPGREKDELMLCRQFDEDEPLRDKVWRSEMFVVDQGGELRRVETLPRESYDFTFRLLCGEDVWSPDGAYLLTTMPEEGDDYENGFKAVAVETASGNVTAFTALSTWQAMRWIDDRRFESVYIDWPEEETPSASETGSETIVVYEMDATTGASEVLREFALAPGEHARPLLGGRYAMVSPSGDSHETVAVSALALMDLSDGRRIDLPPRGTKKFGWNFNWNPQAQRLVYAAAPAPGEDGASLVVASPEEGVAGRLRLPGRNDFSLFTLSPDGGQVFYVRRSLSKAFVVSGLPWCEVWNVDTGEVAKIKPLNPAAAVLSFLMSSGGYVPYDLPSWAPDGRSVVFQDFGRWPTTAGYVVLRATLK